MLWQFELQVLARKIKDLMRKVTSNLKQARLEDLEDLRHTTFKSTIVARSH